MLSRNDAEQVVHSYVDGALADTDMEIVSKSFSFTLADGATDFALGDKFTIALTQNPPAAGAVTADSANTGNGVGGSVTVVGEVPEETITLKCTATATDSGTFSVEGSKSGKMDDLTVAVAYTHVYQQIAVGDQILAALSFPDAGGVPVCRKDTITISAGNVQSSVNLSAANLYLVWRDVTAG